MATNSKGRMFISYRRLPDRTEEAILVRNALRDRGIQTWRDIDNLESKPTEDELIKILKDNDTAGAILLIAEEVADSTMIKYVEAPRIFNRHRENDQFIIKPVLIGVNYEHANDLLNAPAGFQNLGNWNLFKLNDKFITTENAISIANQILKARLKQISVQYEGAPLDIRIHTRGTPNPEFNALSHDFSSYFNGREATLDAYIKIEQAFKDTTDAIAATQGNAEIIAGGNAALPIGVLFGSIFSPLRKFKVRWLQSLAGHNEECWSLDVGQSDIKIQTQEFLGDTGSEDVVLALGISANIEHAVKEFINQSNLSPRASIYTQLETGSLAQGTALSPQDGLSITLQTIDAVRNLKDELMLKRINLHLFMACPLAMSVLIGQKLNTISKCAVYEHTPTGEQTYKLAHTFMPSDN